MPFRPSGFPAGAQGSRGSKEEAGWEGVPSHPLTDKATPTRLFRTLPYNNISCNQNILLLYNNFKTSGTPQHCPVTDEKLRLREQWRLQSPVACWKLSWDLSQIAPHLALPRPVLPPTQNSTKIKRFKKEFNKGKRRFSKYSKILTDNYEMGTMGTGNYCSLDICKFINLHTF